MQRQDVELGAFFHPDEGVHPGVILLHDVWGLSDHFCDLASRLAEAGFGVLALDIYRREASVEIENPGVWMRGLSDPEIQSDIEAAAEFLRAAPATKGQKVGVVGFCMGGMYSLLAGCGGRGIDAAVVFYGLLSHAHGILHDDAGLDPARKPRQPLDAVPDLQCPLLGLFGEEDEFIPLDDIRKLESRLADVDVASEVVVYPGAGHAFMNETREAAFRPKIAAEAWGRMKDFFAAQLS